MKWPFRPRRRPLSPLECEIAEHVRERLAAVFHQEVIEGSGTNPEMRGLLTEPDLDVQP